MCVYLCVHNKTNFPIYLDMNHLHYLFYAQTHTDSLTLSLSHTHINICIYISERKTLMKQLIIDVLVCIINNYVSTVLPSGLLCSDLCIDFQAHI